MNLGADIAAALPQLRRQAESMMRDECTITRAGTQTWDDATGTHLPGSTSPAYALSLIHI